MLGAWKHGWNPPDPPTHPTGQGIGNIGGEVIPDRIVTEPLVGYRVWRVQNAGDGTGLRLASLHLAYRWEKENTAHCNPMTPWGVAGNGHHPDKVSPAPDCACGLYAQTPDKPITEWLHMRKGSVTASGSIAMTGRIIVCERGYKAQHALIQSPVVLEASCHAGCDNTPTTVEIPDSASHLYWTVCDEHRHEEPHADPRVTVGIEGWMRTACAELSGFYDVEVFSWTSV